MSNNNVKKEIVAMLLAGGKGTRLGVMTDNVAKPAVSFGGEYRLIDFPLSNCANSGIDTVGVLTQYEPLELNSYIGNGSSWDLDRKNGGVTVLPPYITSGGAKWYSGTANAVFQNIKYIESYNPEYVLILSGDHIYKMNYMKMLNYHKEKEADVSIGVIEVPWEEASRFGIMNTNKRKKIIEFQEKPDNPKSNLASMGIYIFKWDKLKRFLLQEHNNPDTGGDFGNDVLPAMMEDDLDFYAYEFEGYWRDVGTLESYWQTHMELLSDKTALSLHDRSWIISSVNPAEPPLYISDEAHVSKVIINKGAEIYGHLSSSVVSFGSIVGEDSIVKNSVILSDVEIGRGCNINKAIVCSGTKIGDNCNIGAEEDDPELTVIGPDEKISDGVFIEGGSVIGGE